MGLQKSNNFNATISDFDQYRHFYFLVMNHKNALLFEKILFKK